MTLAQYQAKSDELPADEYVSLASLDRLTQKLAQILADLMALLVGGQAVSQQESPANLGSC